MKNVDNPFQSPTVLSLCTGMRGIETGIERVIGPVRVAAYVEIEAFIIHNLVRQMEQGVVDAAPVWTDVKTFPAEHFHGKVHWIIGGYPCQPFSTAGKQKGVEDPRHLWPYIKEIIRTIRPAGCFFENVANHLNIGYREVRRDLEEMGYAVKEGIFSAEEVGAPHKRERLFILALANPYSIDRRVLLHTRSKENETTRRGEELAESSQQLHDRTGDTGPRRRIKPTNSGQELADSSSSQGLQEQREQVTRQEQQTAERSGSIDRWPAGQGNTQYEWEEPRTVESGVGCTIDGYNFREDLLRMYGNGVVPAVSSLAFASLLQKHFNNE